MLAWSVEAARAAGCFDRILVSTDDDEIASVAQAYGAEVPFRRPDALASDHATTVPVIAHALNWLVDSGVQPHLACCLYATAPFIQPKELLAALGQLRSSGADYAFTCTTYSYPIQRALRIDAGRIAMVNPEHVTTRSQDLEATIHDAGQFYWGRMEAWTTQVPLLGRGSVPFMIPRYRVQDIDTEEDWVRAELMHSALDEWSGNGVDVG